MFILKRSSIQNTLKIIKLPPLPICMFHIQHMDYKPFHEIQNIPICLEAETFTVKSKSLLYRVCKYITHEIVIYYSLWNKIYLSKITRLVEKYSK